MKLSFFFILVLFVGCAHYNTFLITKQGETEQHEYELVDLDSSSLSVFRTHRDDIIPDQNKRYDSAYFVETVKIPFDSIAYVQGPLRRWWGEKILTGLGLGLLSTYPLGYIAEAILPARSRNDLLGAFTGVISSFVIGQFLSHMLQDPMGVIDLHNSEQVEYMWEHSIRTQSE